MSANREARSVSGSFMTWRLHPLSSGFAALEAALWVSGGATLARAAFFARISALDDGGPAIAAGFFGMGLLLGGDWLGHRRRAARARTRARHAYARGFTAGMRRHALLAREASEAPPSPAEYAPEPEGVA